MVTPEPDPESVRGQALALMEEGGEHLRSGHPQKAYQSLDRSWRLLQETREQPVWAVALGTLLVRACHALGKVEDIQRRALDLYAAGVRDPTVVEMRVRAFMASGYRDDPEVLEAFVACVECGDDVDEGLVADILSLLAVALEVDLKADPEETRELCPLLERLHAARPGAVFPNWQLGRYHYLQRDYVAALQFFDQVSGHLAMSPRLLNLRARCTEKLGDLFGAAESYRRSLSRDPEQAHIHFRLGRILLHSYLETT